MQSLKVKTTFHLNVSTVSVHPFIPSLISVSLVTGPVAMAKDPLAEAGFYFDELNKLRVLEPDVSQKTSELKEECKEFVDSKH